MGPPAAPDAEAVLVGVPRGSEILRGSIDDVLGDLLGYDDETPVKSARASQPAGSSGGRARGTSLQASKKSFLEDDFFSKLPAEEIKATEESSASDSDPQALLQTLKDMDDMEADLLGISKPSSGPGKTTVKGPGKCDSSGGAVKTAEKLLAPEKGESAPLMEKKPLASPPAARQYKKFNFEDLDDPLAGLLSDEEQDAPKKPALTGAKSSSENKTERSKEKEPPPPQMPLHTAAPARRREELTFEDEGDDLMDALGFGNGPKGNEKQGKKAEEEELRPARSKLDELLGRGSVAKILEQPSMGEHREFQLDKKYQKQPVPTALIPGEQETQGPAPLAQGFSLSSSHLLSPSPQAESPALGLLHERRLGTPAAQLHEDATGCRAALLSAQARVAELESQVRMLELERTQHKLLLESLQQRHQEDLDLLENAHRSRVKVVEETYGQREERLRREKEQLAAQLLSQSQDAEQARAELLAQHQQRLAALEQQSTLELERLRELQRVSVQEMRKDHEEQLQRLKRLKDQEIDAVTSATSHTRSLNGVIEQMEKFSSDLHDLSHKVEATHHSTSQELAMGARQRDQQLRVLQDRLSQQQRDMEEERSRLQEVIAKMEARLGEQTRLLEQERWRATAEQSKVESLQHSLEEQRRIMTQQLSMERAELERAKSALLEEQKSVMQKCSEERRKLAAEWAEFHTRQQLSKERMERDMDRALQMDSQREGTIMSLAKEQAELKIRGHELKAKEEQLARDRELLEEAWQELRLEKEKVNGAALRIRQREEEIKNMTKLSSQKYEEGERALREACRIESEHQSRLRVMQQHLEQLKQQEQHLQQERLSMAHQRRQLEQLREELPSNPVMLPTADQDLSAPTKGLSSTLYGHLRDTDSEYLHWLVTNIPGNDIKSGKEICHYLPPFPAMGTGYHRFIFLLFKQDCPIDFSEDVRPTPCSVSISPASFPPVRPIPGTSRMASPIFQKLECSICLELFKVPVTLPCGHNFCKSCISDHWDKQEQVPTGAEKGYTCPQCRRGSEQRPFLEKNVTLCSMVELARDGEARVPGTERCEVAPGELCPQHGRPLELYCEEEQRCICCVCTIQQCQRHRRVLLEEERSKKQEFPLLPSPKSPEVLVPTEFNAANIVKPIAEILIDVSRLLLEDLPGSVASKAPDTVGQGLVQPEEPVVKVVAPLPTCQLRAELLKGEEHIGGVGEEPPHWCPQQAEGSPS
ncbi:hypothetical protein llap_16762 [Limosa lapponica baueri]|uniref:Uncharacterized protein n=1 Tax=Limosa lapponica baueri TaxID=1758121 RepID=A0A2I0TGK4_LIMLA|nr:hypothetical protein llap_16762 [Limosa lapponica baueri]